MVSGCDRKRAMRAPRRASTPRVIALATRALAVTVALGIGSGSLVSPALAAPGTTDSVNKDKARALAQDGIKAFESGNHPLAIDLFEQAEQLFHAPVHLLFLARAHAAMGKLLEAKKIYARLQHDDLGPKPPPAWVSAKDAGSKEADELARRIPRLVIVVSPSSPDTTLTMNGDPLPGAEGGAAPAGGVEVDPGTYVLKATSAAGKSVSQTVEAKERATIDVRLVVGPAAQVESPPPLPEAPKSSPLRPVSIAMMSVGGAALVAGAVIGGLGLKKRGDANDAFSSCEKKYGKGHCQGSEEDDVKSKDDSASLFGNVGIGLLAGGAAVAVTGVVLFAVGGKHSPTTQPQAAVRIEPIFSPGFAGVRGSF